MYVIGTAGHVDHGKSTLVKALTGIDPDRLKEEKEREMTIDLGFAWLTLPDGREVSVIDVPGHERFVRNMLAGVGGIDLAMLIVAADEGVMPQTREHLAILDLLHVKKGIVVMTKKDLVDEDFLELVTADVEEVLEGTELEGAPITAVSSITGEGLEDLKGELARLLDETPARRDLGKPRLPIDRSFVMSGFGTVVTGTLTDGSLQAGQEVEIVPGGRRARIRGLQSHRKKLDEAGPGRRLAVNLSGIGHEELHRGDVLTIPGWLVTTEALDGKLRMVRDTPGSLKHGASVTFHSGAFESPAKIRLLDANELKAGDEGWVQVKTQWPSPAIKGDLFILRDSRGTLAGGEIVEPRAKRHRRFQQSLLEHLELLEAGTPEEVVLEALATHEPCQASSLTTVTTLPWDDVRGALESLVNSEQAITLGQSEVQRNTLMYSSHGCEALKGRVEHILGEHHARFPIRRGMAKEEVRSRLELPSQAFGLVVQHLVASKAIEEEGPVLRRSGHRVSLDQQRQQEVERYLTALSATPFSPPSDIRIDPELFSFLQEQGRVVRASSEAVFTTEAYEEMVAQVTAQLREKGTITVAQVRDMFGTSRKYVLGLLEYMDQQRITRRVGDERVLR